MQLEFESARLSYKPLSAEDIDIALEMFRDADVMQYITGAPMTREEIVEELPLTLRRAGGGCIGIWSVRLTATGEKLGSCFLLPMPMEGDDTDWDLVQGEAIPEGRIEIGYIFKKSAWGKGYATEAARRLLAFAFHDTPLTEVYATLYDENRPSHAVLLKAGLKEIGRIRAYGEDSPGYHVTRSDWLRKRNAL